MTKDEVLKQPEQEPVATIAVRWHEPVGKVAFVLEVNLPVGIHKVYTTSPQPEPVIDKSAAVRIATALGWEPKRTWVGLTQEDIDIAFDETQEGGGFWEFADAIEAKLKEKNT